MIYVYRVRRLVKIVRDETRDPTDLTGTPDGSPYLIYCLLKFQQLNKKYTESKARQVLAMATGEKKYLSSIDGHLATDQRLAVLGEGLILLTPTGFANALGESIGKISPIISAIISIIALIVSILVAVSR